MFSNVYHVLIMNAIQYRFLVYQQNKHFMPMFILLIETVSCFSIVSSFQSVADKRCAR
uniref:Uncharacterized protein n=1 Tax=Anguilla anguilla TaxID=7936 RepID=A0A0E9XPS4_ANGAN